MRPRKTDSRQWTGELGVPAPHPYALHQRQMRPYYRDYSSAQNWAKLHAALLIVSPSFLWVAGWLSGIAIRDLRTAAPPVSLYWAMASVAGLIFLASAEFNILPRLCHRLAQAGWMAAIAMSIFSGVTAVSAHRVAIAGPMLRAQIVDTQRHGRGGRSTITFALQDGTTVAGVGYPHDERNCFSVRRLEEPNGFAWLKIVDAAPPPGSGQLHWPIGREECFSGRPLAIL